MKAFINVVMKNRNIASRAAYTEDKRRSQSAMANTGPSKSVETRAKDTSGNARCRNGGDLAPCGSVQIWTWISKDKQAMQRDQQRVMIECGIVFSMFPQPFLANTIHFTDRPHASIRGNVAARDGKIASQNKASMAR
ncbi:hypothetical protein NAC44_04085 [Allorhizobium sp. BGMRC 0089]|uniref:hypothetical protein n=1 Tax=Allorhizobium sonneratiae TaxID=2934936 RepID=UPI0020343219|nr:hypothetical protein [Allorhizobium sonneratiae]MCM2291506.1 hypothetical protein [Allorhizobium sonneratiae]